MKISDFSKLSNTSTRMLRHYEKMGLLNVERTNTNNYRDYAPEELKRVANIKFLQALGFSLAAIKEILNAETSEEMSIYFEKQKNELQTALEKVQSQQSLLDSIASTLADNTKHLDYYVSLKEIPERQVMSLREVVSTYEEEQTLWQKLYQEFVRQEVIFEIASILHKICCIRISFTLSISWICSGNFL